MIVEKNVLLNSFVDLAIITLIPLLRKLDKREPVNFSSKLFC